MGPKDRYNGVNSRRRGVPSSEPYRMERRGFVEEMQKMATEGKLDRPLETVSAAELLKATKVVEKATDFSAALAMAEASLEEPEEEEEVVEEMRVYKAGTFVPERWMLDLNVCMYPAARLICFHGIGQSHMFFRSWAAEFKAANVALHAVCLPGRCHRVCEDFCGVLDAAKYIAQVIELYHENGKEEGELVGGGAKWAQVPTFFYGHCMGALVAFEVAKTFNMQFLDKGHSNYQTFRLEHLIVSSARPPQLLSDGNKDRYMKKWTMQSDSDLMNRAAQLGGIPQVLRNKHRRDIFRLFVPAIRQDYYAYEKYDYVPMERKAVDDRGSVDCPISVFGAKDDKQVPDEEVQQWELATDWGNKPDQQNHKYFFLVGGHTWQNIKPKENILLHFLLQACTGVPLDAISVSMPSWEDEDGDEEYVRDVETFYG